MNYSGGSTMKHIFTKLREFFTNRRYVANLLMISFILFTAIGAGLVFPPAGFIVAGITCGILGYLLGLE